MHCDLCKAKDLKIRLMAFRLNLGLAKSNGDIMFFVFQNLQDFCFENFHKFMKTNTLTIL